MSPPWSGRHLNLTYPWLTSAPYPSASQIVVEAKRVLARNADFQYLEEPDLLWTGVILADKAQKDRQDRDLQDRDFLLDSTIGMGLYNNEVANSFVEKSMRYTAVSTSLLYDHVVGLEHQVTRRYPSS